VFQPDYVAQAEACNLARNYQDIQDSWESLKSIITFYGDDDNNFSSVAGPGYFNDPDMAVFTVASSQLFYCINSTVSGMVFRTCTPSFCMSVKYHTGVPDGEIVS